MKKLFCSFVVLLVSTICFAITPANSAVIGGRFYPIDITQTETASPIAELPGHFNNKIKVIFSDIDGTIMPFNKSNDRKINISEETKQAVIKLQKASVPLVLITGRSYAEAKAVGKVMSVEKPYIITQQGAEIFAPDGKQIYSDGISNKDSLKMLDILDKYQKNNDKDLKFFFYSDSKLYSKGSFRPPYNVSDEIITVKSWNEVPADFKIQKIAIVQYNPEKLKAVQAYMKKNFPQYNIYISADCYCDIIKYGTSKGNAMRELAKIMKINLKNTAALGDAENDISMINLARQHGGLGIAVGNAMASVKQNANYVTAPVTENGFAKAIDKILENNAILK